MHAVPELGSAVGVVLLLSTIQAHSHHKTVLAQKLQILATDQSPIGRDRKADTSLVPESQFLGVLYALVEQQAIQKRLAADEPDRHISSALLLHQVTYGRTRNLAVHQLWTAAKSTLVSVAVIAAYIA